MPRNRGPKKPPSRVKTQNAYAALANRDDNDQGEEMNSHLQERFSGPRHSQPDRNRVPLPLPTRLNNDIEKYFVNAENAITSRGEPTTAPWQTKPEIPSASEILTPMTFLNPPDRISELSDFDPVPESGEPLRPNKVTGAYQDKAEYLSTQYDLLREDAVRPLREAVDEVRKNPWREEADYPQASGIGIYEPTYFKSVVFSQRGLAARVAFSLRRVGKYIRWKQSKRLITGSLVALTPVDDAFRSVCILATVAARPLTGLQVANPPELDLFFAQPQEFQLDPMRKWIMVECRSSFFEASRHTLLSLQHMMHEPFPLSEHLVEAQADVNPPAYRQRDPVANVSCLVDNEDAGKFSKVNVFEPWPESQTYNLDKSQLKALQRILTKRLAIVQGPPGTGKTYVSVVALKILLANRGRDDPPIIVTCQTNHALDQLLRHIAEFEPSFIRLGGRSKDQGKIKERTLYEVREKVPRRQRSLPGNKAGQSRGVLQQQTRKMRELLAPLEAGGTCLDHRYLLDIGVITKEQAASLEAASSFGASDPGLHLEEWVGKQLEPCRGPSMPDEFGVEWEDEDFDSQEQVEELEAEAVARDDDIEALKGPVFDICDNWTGKTNTSSRSIGEIEALLDCTSDLNSIPSSDRGVVYNYFLQKTKEFIFGNFRMELIKYEQAVYHLKIGKWQEDQVVLSTQRLVGMTTTGLSKYRALIASLRPSIVLVEEAAETLEGPVTAACLPTLEHLILVGDHQQLRPHAQVHELENEPYNLNLSLFERMVKNGLELDCLTRQRRMVPEIRALLKPIYGAKLKDHVSVTNVNERPLVEGMGNCRLFFMNHEWPEGKDNNMSAYNATEAVMITRFFNHLVLNGVASSEITILTFYNGQRKRILQELSHQEGLRGCRFNVVTVDSYQGEENEVVVLSLVRNNSEGIIGFLSVVNRVCVALSRAKRGFYMFGNSEMLAKNNKTWKRIVKSLWNSQEADGDEAPTVRRIGKRLPVVCSNHGNTCYMEHPECWDLINGGCDLPCEGTLFCGHPCVLKCHPFGHEDVNCLQKCSKRLACNHDCSATCCEPCKCLKCETKYQGQYPMVKRVQSRAKAGPSLVDSVDNRQPATGMTPTRGPRAPKPRPGSHTVQRDTTVDAQKWDEYAQGGIKDDDAQAMKEFREQEADIVKQMAEPRVISSVAPLIDLDDELPPLGRVSQRETFSYRAPAASPSKQGNAPVNLLD